MLLCSVQTDGINIDEMLQYDKILDLRRLSCNNVHVMARYISSFLFTLRSVSDPDPYGSTLIWFGWIRIQEGKNRKKFRNFMF
jgi:hypothetical protein